MSTTPTYSAIRAKLKEKLGAIKDDSEVTMFDLIVDREVDDGKTFDKYPAIVLKKIAGLGEVQDTHRNEREWHFLVNIYYAKNIIKEVSSIEVLTDTIADKINESFDEDYDLDNTVDQVEVVPVTFVEEMQEDHQIVSQFVIIAKGLTNRN